MAADPYYYGLSRGEKSVTVDAAQSTAKAVEVVVDLNGGMTRAEVVQALREIERYILEDQWHPAQA